MHSARCSPSRSMTLAASPPSPPPSPTTGRSPARIGAHSRSLGQLLYRYVCAFATNTTYDTDIRSSTDLHFEGAKRPHTVPAASTRPRRPLAGSRTRVLTRYETSRNRTRPTVFVGSAKEPKRSGQRFKKAQTATVDAPSLYTRPSRPTTHIPHSQRTPGSPQVVVHDVQAYLAAGSQKWPQYAFPSPSELCTPANSHLVRSATAYIITNGP